MRRIAFIIISFIHSTLCAQFLQPQWEFPLFFETGDGQRDTIWFGIADGAYEDWGPGGSDTLFGEQFIARDSSAFNIAFSCPDFEREMNRLVFSWEARKLYTWFGGNLEVCFPVHGIFPVTISWEPGLLFGEKFPFPSVSTPGAPNAVMMISCNHPHPVYNGTYCPQTPYFYCPADPLGFYDNFGSGIVLPGNSLVIPGPAEFGLYLTFVIEFAPYGALSTAASNSPPEAEDFTCLPQPFSDVLTIESNHLIESVSLINLQGVNVLNFENINQKKTTLELSQLPAGIYFLTLNQSGVPEMVIKQ